MRSKLKATALALGALGVLAITGATASASAAICHESEHGGTVGLCVEKAKVTGQLVSFTGSRKENTGTVILRITGGAQVTCKTINASGVLNTKGTSLVVESFKLEFPKCEVATSPTKCAIPTFTMQAVGSFSGENTQAVTLKGSLTEGEKFGEAEIIAREGQTCSFTRSGNIVGSMKCRLPHSEEELATHEMQCLASESAVRWTGLSAAMEFTEQFKLESGKLWGLMVS